MRSARYRRHGRHGAQLFRPSRSPLRTHRLLLLVVVYNAWFVGYAAAGTGGGKKTPLVPRMLDGNVCNLGINAVAWTKFWFSPKGTARLVNADFGLSRTAKTIGRVEFKLLRCTDSISYNTCEYFDTWKFAVGNCALMRAAKMPWSQWVASIQPPIYCPIKAGNYSFRDGGVDSTTLEQFGLPLENAVWIVTLKVFDQDAREYVCLNYTGEFKRSRAHR